jgi:hypothetical protein
LIEHGAKSSSGWRLPAPRVERAVQQALATLLRLRLGREVRLDTPSADSPKWAAFATVQDVAANNGRRQFKSPMILSRHQTRACIWTGPRFFRSSRPQQLIAGEVVSLRILAANDVLNPTEISDSCRRRAQSRPSSRRFWPEPARKSHPQGLKRVPTCRLNNPSSTASWL